MITSKDAAPSFEHLHASCVAVGNAAVLLCGASGSGKSALALQLIGLGGVLIGDDMVRVTLNQGVPIAHAPDRLAGVIEARGVGLIQVPFQKAAPVHLIVDMDSEEQRRLPPDRWRPILGCEVALLHRVDAPYFAAAVFNLLRAGRYT